MCVRSHGREQQTEDSACVCTCLLPPSRPLPLTLTNGEAWRRGVLLEVAGERFAVEVNPPTVDKVC